MNRRLNELRDNNGVLQALQSDTDWKRRLDGVEAFKQHLNTTYVRHCDPTQPFQFFVTAVINITINVTYLQSIRPMFREPGTFPPHVESNKVLQFALVILEKSLAGDFYEITAPWRWSLWVQWHPLAVALAEVCIKDHGELADRAWPVLDQAYDRLAKDVADTEKGLLWRPIWKLMKKARSMKTRFESERQRSRQHSQSQSHVQTQQMQGIANLTLANQPDPSAVTTTMPFLHNFAYANSGYQVPMPPPSMDSNMDVFELGHIDFSDLDWSAGQMESSAWDQWNGFIGEFGGGQGSSSESGM